ncbi:MAG: ribonucleoside-triphosphate reductase, adenosylcobalamin-dependent [Eubacteriales bacterium]
MYKVIKRDGTITNFDLNKIKTAIQLSMAETKEGVDEKLTNSICKNIEEELTKNDKTISVEIIQDLVEKYLMDSPHKDAAKRYILYRYERDKTRDSRSKRIDGRLLSEEFISPYKHKPNPMKQLGNFVYYRTYSRWLPEENRREYWWETVRRAVEYNCSLVPTTKSEAEKLYDNIFNLRQFLSGRTFWVGGTDVSNHYPMANYNCAFQIIDNFDTFKDLFYLLMIGSGVGIRILRDDINKLPRIRTNFEVINEDYTPMHKSNREDSTSLTFTNNSSAKIIIGDSKEGWVQSLDFFLKLLYSNEYRHINTIIINYNNVRPKGERLKTFGGSASGHTSLKNMFSKITKVIKKRGLLTEEHSTYLKPIDCLDIANIIGENVVVGGVRRTAEIILVDVEDKESIEAKNNLYKQIDGQWIVDQDIIHRQMSNNSIYYREKPTKEQLQWQLQQMRYSGEPGWINEIAGSKRRPNMNGVNPCGEILLDSKGLCNLTTINVYSFVNEDGEIDYNRLYEAQKLSARAGYRMTCVELEIPEWNYVQKRDKLIGCSLTGWQDMVNSSGLNKKKQAELLQKLRRIAQNAAKDYAKEIGDNAPLLVTTVKPEGTLSQLPTVSSGVHYSHSPYYIRRIRINADDPLLKVCDELDYPIHPEVGQDIDTCTTKVIEFPIKAPKGKTKYDVSAIEQLENYKLFMENYVDHNCSITVHVRDNEWNDVEEWVWNHWEDIVAVSFLGLDNNFYQLLPYESITEDEYNKRIRKMKPFIPNLISKYEKEEQEFDIGNESCENGICPIR